MFGLWLMEPPVAPSCSQERERELSPTAPCATAALSQSPSSGRTSWTLKPCLDFLLSDVVVKAVMRCRALSFSSLAATILVFVAGSKSTDHFPGDLLPLPPLLITSGSTPPVAPCAWLRPCSGCCQAHGPLLLPSFVLWVPHAAAASHLPSGKIQVASR